MNPVAEKTLTLGSPLCSRALFRQGSDKAEAADVVHVRRVEVVPVGRGAEGRMVETAAAAKHPARPRG